MDTQRTHISESYLALKTAVESKGFILCYAHKAYWILDESNKAHMRGTFEEVSDWVENTDHKDNLKETYQESEVKMLELEQLTTVGIANAIVATILFGMSLITGINWIGFIALPFYIYAFYRYFTNRKIRNSHK
jgi:hypothetical protein